MEEKLRGIVRIANTDIIGTKSIYNGLRKIKGINFMMSNALCNNLNLDEKRKVGSLNEDEVKKIENMIKHPDDLPSWLLNRRKDFDAGKNLHLTGGDLGFSKEFDIKRMKKLKSYKGLRHAWGQPVRGQRTRSHFRTGISVGVQRKAAAAKQKSAEKETKKGKNK